jgi:hypothetical protein
MSNIGGTASRTRRCQYAPKTSGTQQAFLKTSKK